MAIDRARAHLARFGAENKIRELPESSATVALAAEALGVEPARIAKSIAFKVDGKAVLIVAAGDAKIDNGRFKERFHTKAKMLTPQETENMVGHAVGGVCPFGAEPDVQVFLDESLRRFPTVFPACGSSNSVIELTVEELEQFSPGSRWAALCKLPENM